MDENLKILAGCFAARAFRLMGSLPKPMPAQAPEMAVEDTLVQGPADANAFWVERIAAASLLAQQLALLMMSEARELIDAIRAPEQKALGRQG